MLFRWLLSPWHYTQRSIDLQFLWPACKQAAKARGRDLEDAKAAFAFHAFNDTPWLALGEDEIQRRIDALE